MGDTPTPEYAQFIEQTFTPMRLADGRTLRVPDSPPPCLADPESGFIWFKLPALWLLPPPYRPPGLCIPREYDTKDTPTPQTSKWLLGQVSSEEVSSPLSPKELSEISTPGLFRPIDWRRRLASHHVAIDQIPEDALGDEVLLAWFFLLARPRCRTTLDFVWLRTWLPVVKMAFQIYEHRRTRLEVEARLLAREPIDSVARKLSLRSQAVAMFQSLFFDVSGRLDAPGWVMNCLVRWHDPVPSDPLEREGQIWKYFGYRGGPDVLDDLIYGFVSETKPRGPDDFNNFITENAVAAIRRKACIALHTMPVDSDQCAKQILRDGQRLDEISQRQKRAYPAPAHDFRENIKVALEQFPEPFKAAVLSKH